MKVNLGIRAVLSGALLSSVRAWGPMGHSTVAAIATRFLKPETLEKTKTILSYPVNGTSYDSLVSVANWPDVYRKTPEGAFSAHFHFIDAEDDPFEGSCLVVMERDCPKENGCIVTAIANYTHRISDPVLPSDQHAEALRFLTHFFGDLHQPLHAEGIKHGGNAIPVLFEGKRSNLHRAWDYDKLAQAFGNYSDAKAYQWAGDIVREITVEGGRYHVQAKEWIRCRNIENPAECPLVWATEVNQLNCDYVLSHDPTNKEINDGAFYPDWLGVIQGQVARGGVRLAAWLNLIFTGSVGFEGITRALTDTTMEEPRYHHLAEELR